MGAKPYRRARYKERGKRMPERYDQKMKRLNFYGIHKRDCQGCGGCFTCQGCGQKMGWCLEGRDHSELKCETCQDNERKVQANG